MTRKKGHKACLLPCGRVQNLQVTDQKSARDGKKYCSVILLESSPVGQTKKARTF